MIDDDPKLQCSGTRNADLFGFETGAKGVWILENPSQEQIEKLDEFPESTNQTVTNGYLVCRSQACSSHQTQYASLSQRPSSVQGSKDSIKTRSLPWRILENRLCFQKDNADFCFPSGCRGSNILRRLVRSRRLALFDEQVSRYDHSFVLRFRQ